jgi:SAM-dependent methyltransferase
LSTVVAVGELGLRNDLYRRPLATALKRLGLAPGWRCVDVGAGAGDVSVALAELVGREGRVYAVDSDPRARDEVAAAAAAAGGAQVIAITQAGEDLALPESVDLAYCRFLLMHVLEPRAVLQQMVAALRPGGYLLAQEPITSAGRIDGLPMSMPEGRHPDVGALLPRLVREAGLKLVDAWAEAPAGAGPGPVATYLEELTEVEPGDASVVLPPLVTVIGRRAGPEDATHPRQRGLMAEGKSQPDIAEAESVPQRGAGRRGRRGLFAQD